MSYIYEQITKARTLSVEVVVWNTDVNQSLKNLENQRRMLLVCVCFRNFKLENGTLAYLFGNLETHV